jgi:aminoglycoside phosphotransferase (APT) family kinase protein
VTDEIPLTGGNANAAVRVGDTVRRTAGPWTPTVHALLRHLRDRGIDWVPAPHGFDEQGREVLDFLPGEVPAYPLPRWIWEEAVLADAAARLRAFHDATVDFDRAGRIWQQPEHPPVEVVCHNDFAATNLVFRQGRIVGAIDVDMASPGSRAWDAAHLAHRMVPLTTPGDPDTPDLALGERRRRLRLLCDAYGGLEAEAVLDRVPARLRALARWTDDRAAAVPQLAGHAVRYRGDAAWIEQHRAPLLGRD